MILHISSISAKVLSWSVKIVQDIGWALYGATLPRCREYSTGICQQIHCHVPLTCQYRNAKDTVCWRYFKIVLHMQSLSIGERQRFELSGLGRSSVTMCVLSGTLCVSVVRLCTHIRFSVRLCQIHYQPPLQQSENANVVLLS